MRREPRVCRQAVLADGRLEVADVHVHVPSDVLAPLVFLGARAAGSPVEEKAHGLSGGRFRV